MENQPPSPSSKNQRASTVFDLDADALAHCARNLSLQDLSNMAMTCKFFRGVAYSDSIWHGWLGEHCPQQYASSSFSQISGAREAYLARRTALHQFKFHDPLTRYLLQNPTPCSHILLDKNDVYLAQGSSVFLMEDAFSVDKFSSEGKMQWAHNARITCMRLFSNKDTWFRREAQNNDNVLVTSSCDWTIRLWWKGRSQRCLRGHNGPVTTLADKLLGDSSEVLASGGEDGTVRLWSLSSSGKRGKRALKTTLHGHEKPVTLLSVPGHNPSLLVSVSKDAKVRVWDTSASSGARSSGCVGMACVHGALVGIKCHEALCYIAAGSSVTAIDLRTMRKVEMTKRCYGILEKIKTKPQPVAIMDGHSGHVAHIHMDPYKIVTGGPEDLYVKVWETDTGILTNSFTFCVPDFEESTVGLLAMAVNGCRIVTSSWYLQPGLICFRDFTNASHPLSSSECSSTTKFWESGFGSDG